jgi:1-acyl-sn-glycerol-3-phosphate acyltransferase
MTGPGKAQEMFSAPATGSAMFQAFCRTFFFCYCPLTVEGRNHLPAPPFILCSNHASHIDSAVLMTASDLPFSTFSMLGASDYFFDSRRIKFVVSRFMNVIPIDRHAQHQSLRRSLAMCDDFLQRRHGNLILYPEGTRSSNGEIQIFKKGAGLFAVELGVPVVPAYIEGARHILPKGNSIPRPGSVTVRFGEPIRFKLNQRDPELDRERRKAAVGLLEQRIRGLSRGPSSEDLTGLPNERQAATISMSTAVRQDEKTRTRKVARIS